MNEKIIRTDGKAKSTWPLMHLMVRKYHKDMIPYTYLTLTEIYEKIKCLPYRADPVDLETLMRPKYTMEMRGYGGDCDDKAIALASWAYCMNIPYRFLAVRKKDKKNLHHVYPELYISGRWVTCDPTYSFNCLGRTNDEYVEKVII
jgi:transglutaminase-like putative cysteine protease